MTGATKKTVTIIEPDEIEKTPEEKPQTSLSLEILRVIKEAQQQHGLRHGDYQRYRGYCSRRVRRLRKVLKLPQGDRRHYKKRDVTSSHLEDPKADVRYLEICVVLAERAWSYAMQLRQEANTEPRKRFHLIRRLRKSVGLSIILESLCNTEFCDARTKLEGHAYKMWLQGTLHFELEEWKQAYECLSVAHKIYTELADALPYEEQTPYRSRCEEISPSLRYCAYNIDDKEIKQSGDNNITVGLDLLMQQAKQRRAEELSETEWRGFKFTVRPERVRLFLIGLQTIDEQLATADDLAKKIAILEQLLMDCKESISAVRDDIKNDPKLKASTGEPLTGTQILLSYLTYIRLQRTIDRNLLLVEQAKSDGKKTKPQEFARFYEIILQNMNELLQLQGFEENATYQAEINLQLKCFKGFRCYYMAKTLEVMKRFTDAFALYERSAKYANMVKKDKKATKDHLELVQKLLDDIDKNKFISHAQGVLEEISKQEEGNEIFKKPTKKLKLKTALYERLENYVEDPNILTRPNLVKFPPDLEAVPCKPLFFDLANNLIEYPNLDDVSNEAAKSKKEGAAGISGLVKSLWGWGGKK